MLIDLEEVLQFFERVVIALLMGGASSLGCIVRVCSEVREFGFVRQGLRMALCGSLWLSIAAGMTLAKIFRLGENLG